MDVAACALSFLSGALYFDSFPSDHPFSFSSLPPPAIRRSLFSSDPRYKAPWTGGVAAAMRCVPIHFRVPIKPTSVPRMPVPRHPHVPLCVCVCVLMYLCLCVCLVPLPRAPRAFLSSSPLCTLSPSACILSPPSPCTSLSIRPGVAGDFLRSHHRPTLPPTEAAQTRPHTLLRHSIPVETYTS